MFKTIIMIILGIVTIQSLPINKTNITMFGGCNGTQFGCCDDLITSCVVLIVLIVKFTKLEDVKELNMVAVLIISILVITKLFYRLS